MTRALLTYIILGIAALSRADSALHEHTAVSLQPGKALNPLADLTNRKDIEEPIDDPDEDRRSRRGRWEPTDAPFQIILGKIVVPGNSTQLEPTFASIFEVDLFDTPVSTFRTLKRQGKKIICYFSAGTSEDWRPDYKDFTAADKGECDEGIYRAYNRTESAYMDH